MVGVRRTGLVPATIAAVVLLVLAACSSAPGGRDGGAATESVGRPSPVAMKPVQSRPFAASSPLNTPIAKDARTDPQSAAMLDGMFGGGEGPIANTDEFGFGIYDADDSTPTHTVTCRKPWGVCPFQGRDVPLTEDMVPPRGSDGQISVIDWSSRLVYDLWQYRWNDGSPSASWGSIAKLDGSGITDPPDGFGNSRGSGFSVLAGVVRRYEIANGRIDHALEFSTNRCKQGEFRAPAFRTDGSVDDPAALPEGARLQLDPSLDVETIPNLSRIEKIVARALQVYGAYAVDCGGAAMAIGFERVPPGGTNPYPAVGITHDYTSLDGIPVDRLRVLSSWNSPRS